MAQITDRIRKLTTANEELQPGPSDARLYVNAAGNLRCNITGTPFTVGAGGGSGDVSGPVSSTDNAIVRWNGTGGDTVQNSGISIGDANDITGVASITVNNGGLSLKGASNNNILKFTPGTTLTATRVFTLVTGDSDRTLTLTGDASLVGTNTGDQLTFKNVAVSGQTTIVAGTTTDTLTLAAGTNITITTSGSTATITAASTSTPADNSVSTVKIQDSAVTSAKIADGTIVAADMAGPIPVLAADPGSPLDNTAWAVVTGTSPTQVCAFKMRLGGVTVTIASITQ